MNRQHNYGLGIVCAMVVLSVMMLRREPASIQALTLIIQLATGIAGGIVGNAMAVRKTRRRKKIPSKLNGS